LFTDLEFEDLECGTLKVKSDHLAHSNTEFELPYLIINPKNPDISLEPIIYLSGGPGFSNSLDNTEIITWFRNAAKKITSNRQFIILELRGTRNAKPSIDCPILNRIESIFNLKKNKFDLEEINKSFEESCLKRLENNEINLTLFNRVQIAHDIKSLMDHIDTEKATLIGSSYGSTYAMTFADMFPELISSMILDSVFPPELSNNIDSTLHFQKTLNLIFKRCEQQLECLAKYPNLESNFYDLVYSLDKNPLEVTFSNSDKTESNIAILDSASFLQFVNIIIGWPGYLEFLPELIVNKNEQLLQLLFQLYIDYGGFDELSFGAFKAGSCFDLPIGFDYDNYSKTASRFKKLELQLWNYTNCDEWNPQRAEEQIRKPLVSNIPTLIITAEFAPATPPSQAYVAAKGLKNSYIFEFSGGGHAILLNNNCAKITAHDFLLNPNKQPSRLCLRTSSKFKFKTDF